MKSWPRLRPINFFSMDGYRDHLSQHFKKPWLLAVTAVLALSLATAIIVQQGFKKSKLALGTSCLAPAADLAAWWTGDNTPVDSVGGNDLAPAGWTYEPSGKVGAALKFPLAGESDTANCVGSTPLGQEMSQSPGSGDWTAEFWLNTPNYTPFGHGLILFDSLPGPTNRQLSITVGNGGVTGYIVDGVNIVGSAEAIGIAPGAGINENQWVHVALVIERSGAGATIKGYYNGSLFHSRSFPNIAALDFKNQGVSNCRIGAESIAVDTKIDELKIYHRALSTSEIQAIYNAGSAGSCKTMVAGTVSCGQTLTAPGTYVMNDDLDCPAGADGVTIAGNNITVDCQKHTLNGGSSNSGVVLNGVTGAAVQNCRITGFNKSIDATSVTDATFKFNKLMSAGGGVHFSGVSTNPMIYGNQFDTRGIVAASGTIAEGTGSLCYPTNAFDGIGNSYEGSISSSEVITDACDDRNGSGTHDDSDAELASSSGFKTVFYDLAERYGVGAWLVTHGFMRQEYPESWGAAVGSTGVAKLEKDCNNLPITDEYSGSCAPDTVNMAVSHPNGMTDVLATPVGGWDQNHAPFLRWEDAIPTLGPMALPAGSKIDVGTAPSADGTHMGAAIWDLPAGSGPTGLDRLKEVTYEFAAPSPGTLTAYCDGSLFVGPVSGCKVVEVRDASGANTRLKMEFWAGTQARPFKNAEGRGLDDEKTGVVSPAGNPLNYLAGSTAAGETHHNADVSVEGPHMLERDNNSDQIAHLDVVDSGWADHATASVTVTGGTVKVKIEPPASMPTADDSLLGGKPPKMGLGMVISMGPQTGTAAPTYSIYGAPPALKDITTLTGMVFTGFGQSDSPAAVASGIDFQSVRFNTVGFNTDVNVRETIDELGTLIVQHVMGAEEYGSGGVIKVGGQFLFNNSTIVNVIDALSGVPSATKALYPTNSSKFDYDYVNYGVGYVDTNGQTADELNDDVNIEGNVMKNVLAGIGVYGAQVRIANNELHLVKPPPFAGGFRSAATREGRTDLAAAALYPDYPADFPTSNGGPTTLRSDFGAVRQHDEGGVGIAVGCGRKNTTADGREGTTALGTGLRPNQGEEDTKGNRMDLLHESLDHQNCRPVLIEGNQLFGNRGLGIKVAGEWDGSETICSLIAPIVIPECVTMPDLNVLVRNNVVRAEGGAPLDEPGDTPASSLPHHTPGSPRPVPADGFDVCMSFSAPGLEELNVNPLVKETISFPDGTSKRVTANLPHIMAKANTCGVRGIPGSAIDKGIGSGGIKATGSQVMYLHDNNVYGAQYVATALACDPGRNSYRRTISGFGENNAGLQYDCGIWLKGGELIGSGTLVNTCTQKYVAESKVGAGDGSRCDALDADAYLVLDSASSIGGAFVKMDKLTANPGKIALDVSGVTGTTSEIENYFDNVMDIIINDVTTPPDDIVAPNFPAEVVAANDPTSPTLQTAIQEALAEAGDACPTVDGSAERQGCPVADENKVELHVVDQAKSGRCPAGAGACKLPLAGAQVKVFDRNQLNGLTISLRGGGTATLVKNPEGSLYDDIFEAAESNANALAAPFGCVTNASGTCLAGEAAVGDYLVIVKVVDPDVGTVYTGKPKSPADFADTNGNGSGDLAFKDFQILKVFRKDGTVQIGGGSKTVVTGSMLEIVYPDLAVWEASVSSYVYPFIFTSDSNWTVDACAQIPTGYQIVGVYDLDGNLLSTNSCQQTFVQGETKVIAFQISEIGSPPPHVKLKLKLKGPNGKVRDLDLDVPGLRKGKDSRQSKGVGN